MIARITQKSGRVVLMTCEHVFFHTGYDEGKEGWVEVVPRLLGRDNCFGAKGLVSVVLYDNGRLIWQRLF